jgi:hypothetical protein
VGSVPLLLSLGGIPHYHWSVINEPKATRWSGVCAGGYFASAAIYMGNVVVLPAFRSGTFWACLAISILPILCVTMGCLVLAVKIWVPRLAVVVAAGFCAIHLIGLAYLFLITPPDVPMLTQSLQWQLGTSLFFLWLTILFASFRLANCFPHPRLFAD